MTDKLAEYKNARSEIPEKTILWPLYGAGFENLGLNGEPIEVDTPAPGPDELLVRHDACGLCFSDTKVINLGQNHPRIYRDIKKEPVVLGHEVSMTVVQAGKNLKDQYGPGDRFIIQADIYIKGVNLAYGYMFQGGLSQYAIIQEGILNGDEGNYLLPLKPETGYAESALTEPWTCVIAAYNLHYRTALKNGGITWIIGTPEAAGRKFSIGRGFDSKSHPARVILTSVPSDLETWVRAQAKALGIEVTGTEDVSNPGAESIDDIVALAPAPEIIEAAAPRLAAHGAFILMSEKPLSRAVSLDVGRIHYDDLMFAGHKGTDIALAYSEIPVRSTLLPGGRALFMGAAGPMGRMHVQRAIQIKERPATIVCTDISDERLSDMRDAYEEEAKQNGITFICLNSTKPEDAAKLEAMKSTGFDDIIVLAPVVPVIEQAETFLAPRGVMNVFAGVARGTMANIDAGDFFLKNTRIIGQSGSKIADLQYMLEQTESGTLSPNRSVGAIGSLSASKEGLQAVKATTFPGKIVIYPNIREFPLTAVCDLKEKLPSVHAKLRNGREWTNEAEAEFLKIVLP